MTVLFWRIRQRNAWQAALAASWRRRDNGNIGGVAAYGVCMASRMAAASAYLA